MMTSRILLRLKYVLELRQNKVRLLLAVATGILQHPFNRIAGAITAGGGV